HSKDPRYLSIGNFFKTGNLFGLQYIYGDMTNEGGGDPLDYDALMASPTEFKIVSTDAATGKPVYFDKTDMKRNDYRVVMASCALPGACKPIEIDGKYYFDGGVSDAIPIRKAFLDGCDKVVVLASKKRDFVKKPEGMRWFYTLACRKYPNTIKALNRRHKMYAAQQKYMFRAEEKGKAFIFAPSDPPKMGTYTKDPRIEQELFDLGVSDYLNLKEDFLKFIGREQ
ncbi:MAG: patatin family protein, partial [Lachnospiraceae bacterium]|nr:patatin family protein [Lachnospiraceae bacterium]